MSKKEECMISIIVPMYNSEKTILALLNSVSKQIYSDYEVLLINDGSTDNTIGVLEEIIDKDKRIVLYNQNNKGAPAARNLGIENAKGKYILFCDADDILADDALEILVESMINSKADIVIANHVYFYNDSLHNSTLVKRYNKFVKRFDTNIRCFFADPIPGTKLYKKEIIEKNKLLFADVRIAQDLNFYIKYLFHCSIICDIDNVTYYYRITEGSISRSYKLDNLLDIQKSLQDIAMELNNVDDIDIQKYKNYIEYLKLINYVGQMRKKRFLSKDDYQILRKTLCSDVDIKQLKDKKIFRANFGKIIEFVLIKYFNILLKHK